MFTSLWVFIHSWLKFGLYWIRHWVGPSRKRSSPSCWQYSFQAWSYHAGELVIGLFGLLLLNVWNKNTFIHDFMVDVQVWLEIGVDKGDGLLSRFQDLLESYYQAFDLFVCWSRELIFKETLSVIKDSVLYFRVEPKEQAWDPADAHQEVLLGFLHPVSRY